MRTSIIVLGTAVVSLAAGGAGGYFYAAKVIEEKYAELAEEEIRQAREYFRVYYKGEGYETPTEAIQTLIGEEATPERLQEVIDGLKALDGYKATSDLDVVKPEPKHRKDVTTEEIVSEHRAQGPPKAFVDYRQHVIDKIENRQTGEEQKGGGEGEEARNVFDDPQDGPPDFRNEPRMPGKPYMISEEEFFAGEKDYVQTTLTWYEGDQILTDERGQPIDDDQVDVTVGRRFLTRFGETGKEKHILHIRNDDLTLDFEVVRDEGRYGQKVAGFDGADG